jgi:hypothetical protein
VERQTSDFVSSGDVCIPILDSDLKWHAAGDPSFVNPFANYVWFGDALGMAQEVSEFESATVSLPTRFPKEESISRTMATIGSINGPTEYTGPVISDYQKAQRH